MEAILARESPAKPAPRYRPSLRWVLVVGVVAVAFWAIWSVLTNPLASDAVGQLHATRFGGSLTLVGGATEGEVRACDLSAKKLDAVWHRLIKPRFDRVEFLGDQQVELLNSPPTEAVAHESFKLPNGLTRSLSVCVFYTEAGGKRSVLSDLLFAAWWIEAELKSDHPTSSTERAEAYLAGLAADRATLEEIGLQGVYFPSRDRFVDWDQLAVNLERDRQTILAQLKGG